jgi:hypothetical protein
MVGAATYLMVFKLLLMSSPQWPNTWPPEQVDYHFEKHRQRAACPSDVFGGDKTMGPSVLRYLQEPEPWELPEPTYMQPQPWWTDRDENPDTKVRRVVESELCAPNRQEPIMGSHWSERDVQGPAADGAADPAVRVGAGRRDVPAVAVSVLLPLGRVPGHPPAERRELSAVR